MCSAPRHAAGHLTLCCARRAHGRRSRRRRHPTRRAPLSMPTVHSSALSAGGSCVEGPAPPALVCEHVRADLVIIGEVPRRAPNRLAVSRGQHYSSTAAHIYLAPCCEPHRTIAAFGALGSWCSLDNSCYRCVTGFLSAPEHAAAARARGAARRWRSVSLHRVLLVGARHRAARY